MFSHSINQMTKFIDSSFLSPSKFLRHKLNDCLRYFHYGTIAIEKMPFRKMPSKLNRSILRPDIHNHFYFSQFWRYFLFHWISKPENVATTRSPGQLLDRIGRRGQKRSSYKKYRWTFGVFFSPPPTNLFVSLHHGPIQTL
jgi:hypothetical protein